MSDAEKGSPEDAVVPPTTSDPYASRVVTHTRYGIWDVYQEVSPDAGTMAVSTWLKEKWGEATDGLPELARAFKDVLAIPGCKVLISIYTAAELAASFMPAMAIGFQGQFLQTMDAAIATGAMDTTRIARVCAGHMACTLAEGALGELKTNTQRTLSLRVLRQSAARAFVAGARLDVPTYARADVRQDLEFARFDREFDDGAMWGAVKYAMKMAATAVRVGTQAWALFNVLRGQPDVRWMAVATLVVEMLPLLTNTGISQAGTAIACTTKNKDYINMRGWYKTVEDDRHRKELVAGDLAGFVIAQFKGADGRLGDLNVGCREATGYRGFFSDPWTMAKRVLEHVPQIVFTIRAARRPERWAESLAALHLVQSAAKNFASSLYTIHRANQNMRWKLDGIRGMYALQAVENAVVDGTVAFPQDVKEVSSGISLEFRNVTFKYPGANKYALKDVSFTLLPGQLCVIVGANGSGKSTILKLIVRLYDLEGGAIFLGGHDIRTLKLSDLRQAISVLFQDYTHFPFSVRDNISLGDPCGSDDDSAVRLAARLGGAEAFVDQLEDGFDTYIDSPSVGYSTGPEEGSMTAAGVVFDDCAVRAAAGMKKWTGSSNLSGGQMQRLAVARSFMRSVVRPDTKVGLLLFDEPSAALDPIAEHNLFDRLRELRGNKTMVFSSHRFGKLTRHADLILYMDDSGVVESGSHDELLGRRGEYARLWEIQAEAFIS